MYFHWINLKCSCHCVHHLHFCMTTLLVVWVFEKSMLVKSSSQFCLILKCWQLHLLLQPDLFSTVIIYISVKNKAKKESEPKTNLIVVIIQIRVSTLKLHHLDLGYPFLLLLGH